MESLPIHVFKNSFGPVIELLNEHKVQYMMRDQRSGVVMASSGVIEVVLQSVPLWGALAVVIVAFIKSRVSRKVIITLKDNTVVQAEGLSSEDLEKVLTRAKSLTAIDTEKDQAHKPETPR